MVEGTLEAFVFDQLLDSVDYAESRQLGSVLRQEA